MTFSSPSRFLVRTWVLPEDSGVGIIPRLMHIFRSDFHKCLDEDHRVVRAKSRREGLYFCEEAAMGFTLAVVSRRHILGNCFNLGALQRNKSWNINCAACFQTRLSLPGRMRDAMVRKIFVTTVLLGTFSGVLIWCTTGETSRVVSHPANLL